MVWHCKKPVSGDAKSPLLVWGSPQISECPSFSGVPKSQHFLRSPDHPQSLAVSPWRDSFWRNETTPDVVWKPRATPIHVARAPAEDRQFGWFGWFGWGRGPSSVKLVGCLVIILCCWNYCQCYNIIIFEITSILSLIENDCHLFNCWGCYPFKIRTPRGDVCWRFRVVSQSWNTGRPVLLHGTNKRLYLSYFGMKSPKNYRSCMSLYLFVLFWYEVSKKKYI